MTMNKEEEQEKMASACCVMCTFCGLTPRPCLAMLHHPSLSSLTLPRARVVESVCP